MRSIEVGKNASESFKPISREEHLKEYLSKIKKFPVLTPEEEASLAKSAKAGDSEALKKLVECNLRFVVSVAKYYQGQYVPFMELISAGNEGLYIAAERFDETKGFKLISYAIYWIRNKIVQSIMAQKNVVYIPEKVLIKKDEGFTDWATHEFGVLPNEESITAEIKNFSGVTPRTVQRVKSGYVSFDEPLFRDEPEGDTLLDRFRGKDQFSRIDKIIEDDESQAELRSVIEKLLEGLDPSQRRVLTLHFGFNEFDKPIKDVTIAEMLQMDEKEVKSLKDKALNALKKKIKTNSKLKFALLKLSKWSH